MSPLAHVLLYAGRYSHCRSLHPYEHVHAAVREHWHLIDAEDRDYLLRLWRDQVPGDIAPYADPTRTSILPVSAREAAEELAAWERLWAWCEAQP